MYWLSTGSPLTPWWWWGWRRGALGWGGLLSCYQEKEVEADAPDSASTDPVAGDRHPVTDVCDRNLGSPLGLHWLCSHQVSHPHGNSSPQGRSRNSQTLQGLGTAERGPYEAPWRERHRRGWRWRRKSRLKKGTDAGLFLPPGVLLEYSVHCQIGFWHSKLPYSQSLAKQNRLFLGLLCL